MIKFDYNNFWKFTKLRKPVRWAILIGVIIAMVMPSPRMIYSSDGKNMVTIDAFGRSVLLFFNGDVLVSLFYSGCGEKSLMFPDSKLKENAIGCVSSIYIGEDGIDSGIITFNKQGLSRSITGIGFDKGTRRYLIDYFYDDEDGERYLDRYTEGIYERIEPK